MENICKQEKILLKMLKKCLYTKGLTETVLLLI